MKMKLIAAFIAASAVFTGASNAVTVSVIGIANDSVGRISLGGSTAVSGTAWFASTTNDIQSGAAAAFAGLLATGGTIADFEAAVTSLIGATSASSPGIVTSGNYTDGLFQLSQSHDVGNQGNQGTFFIVSTSGGSLTGIGAYSGPNVPGAGAMIFNPATTGDLVGTSDGGFQLAPVVPEPSVAILGALGVLGLLRRRR